jgi:hypothetical protein
MAAAISCLADLMTSSQKAQFLKKRRQKHKHIPTGRVVLHHYQSRLGSSAQGMESQFIITLDEKSTITTFS